MKKLFSLFLLTLPLLSLAQNTGKTVDRIVGVVGGQIVKESDVENAYQQFKGAGVPMSDSLRGVIMDQLLYKKLLINQAKHDSIDVSEDEINAETDRRMRYFLSQFKSEKEFTDFYGKSVDAFKFELHDQVRDLLLAQKMEGKITGDITVSPADVAAYYNSQPPDSLPFISSEVEVGQIVVVPPVSQELKDYARQTLEDVRTRVVSGKLDFCSAAAIYSDDPGSKFNCGKYENVRRGTFVPEFDAVCFSLKEGEISDVFETDYGFHFVKLISRRGEEVTIQHILKAIPVDPDELKKCKLKLDTITSLIRKDSLTFCEAAAKYSADADSKYSCGMIVNPETGTTKIDVEMLGQLDPDPQFPLVVNQMKVGELSAPQPCVTR
ncbi:MAG TPA: peptidylprolyl isomerase, partial [Bacteroidia bacterium]|nr:peptidylprolyl isomerase [Bacteroidia bacterium]